MPDNPFRSLPSVSEILALDPIRSLVERHSHDVVVAAVRRELADVRSSLKLNESGNGQVTAPALAEQVCRRIEGDMRPRLRTVINATGILLHTNLGRAPIAECAARAAFEAARSYVNLELDLETGKRSSRQVVARQWACRMTGAESATFVNNNAAATVIVLRALCAGKEVVLSRGQLIEIGGSFRIPEIMAVSGATLREVGTTNITKLSDYEKAIGLATGALMQIHTSNYRISGFTKAVALADLAALGKERGLPVIDDIGSGALIDFERFGFQGEPAARQSIAAGADLVLFSGDKLLGGPQAGIIAGRKDFIHRIEKDPLMRAFRLDKMTLAALEATLRLYLNEERALAEIPLQRMLAIPLPVLRQRAEALAVRIREIRGIASVKVIEDLTYVGGGSLPDQSMKSCQLEIDSPEVGDQELSRRLRTGDPAVVGRIRGGQLVLDVRTVFPEQEAGMVEAIRQAVIPG